MNGLESGNEEVCEDALMADASENYVPKLKSHYDSVVRQQLQEEFAYPNPMGVPKLTKIVVNMGVGEAIADSKKLDQAAGEHYLPYIVETSAGADRITLTTLVDAYREETVGRTNRCISSR